MKRISILKLPVFSGCVLAVASCGAPKLCVQSPEAMSRRSWQVPVCSKCLWNQTGILVRKGRTYALKPSGTWTDWFMRCDASGPVSSLQRALLSPSRRFLRFRPSQDKRAHFLCLIVCVQAEPGPPDELPDHAVLVPREGIAAWTAPADGQIFALANDWKIAYGNNKGELLLHVTELPSN